MNFISHARCRCVRPKCSGRTNTSRGARIFYIRGRASLELPRHQFLACNGFSHGLWCSATRVVGRRCCSGDGCRSDRDASSLAPATQSAAVVKEFGAMGSSSSEGMAAFRKAGRFAERAEWRVAVGRFFRPILTRRSECPLASDSLYSPIPPITTR